MSSLVSLAVAIFSVVCMWFIFEKAHEPGWKALIPVYNAYVLAKIAKCKWTFWVKLVLGGLLTVSMVIFAVFFFAGFATAISGMDTYDTYEYDYETPYQQSPIEDDYTITDVSHTSPKLTSDITINGEELTPEMEAEIEAMIDDLIDEMGLTIGGLMILFCIPFLFILPLCIVNFIQYMKLSQAFGLHWAYAFGLMAAKPVCMGIIAFAPDVQYVGDGGYAPDYSQYQYAAAAAAAAAASDNTSAQYQKPPVEYQAPTNNYVNNQGFEPTAPTQTKFVCPGCGMVFDRAPASNTFCPNCGRHHI